jgi:hypothetical protein
MDDDLIHFIFKLTTLDLTLAEGATECDLFSILNYTSTGRQARAFSLSGDPLLGLRTLFPVVGGHQKNCDPCSSPLLRGLQSVTSSLF